jgi:hypothetical protein
VVSSRKIFKLNGLIMNEGIYMIKGKSLVIAAISIIASLASLILITVSWEIAGWLGLWIYVGVMIAIFGSWILLMVKVGIEKNPLKTIDFAIIALFAALLTVVDFGSMFAPGAAVLWYVIPQFAGAILSYFPMGIVLAAALKLSPKPGTAFILFFVYSGILSQVFFFNPVWIPRSIMLSLGLEAYHISSERGSTKSLAIMGIMFGILVPSSAAIFQIYSWGYWQPLFITIPAAIISGIMMSIGTFLGSAIGERAKVVMY